MKQDLIKDVVQGMLPYLNNAQSEKLQEVLSYALAKYEVTENQNRENNSEHPHKFRRTLATMAIDKGMPIEQLQQLLGHRKIDTTLQYAMVKQSNVKIAHRKYIG